MKPRQFFEEVVLSYDGPDCLVWPYGRNGKGYAALSVERKMQLVSRLACSRVKGDIHPSYVRDIQKRKAWSWLGA